MSKKKSKKNTNNNRNINKKNNGVSGNYENINNNLNNSIKNNNSNRPKVKKEDTEQSKLKSVKQTMDKIQSGNSKPQTDKLKGIANKNEIDKHTKNRVEVQAAAKESNIATDKIANVAAGKEEDIATDKIANVAVGKEADIATGKEADAGKFMDFSKIDEEYKGELRRTLTPKERFFRSCEKFGDLFLLNVFFTITS